MGGVPIKIVGIDPSLAGTGICILDTSPTLAIDINIKPLTTLRLINKLTGPDRLIHIRDRVAGICWDADLVVIEDYAYGKGNQAHQIGELGGVLRVMLREADKKPLEVTPGQLKKFATGKGGAKKEEVMLGVYKRWGVEFPTNDECDAFVLAKIGEAFLGWPASGEGLTVPQREVVVALKCERVAAKPKKKKAVVYGWQI